MLSARVRECNPAIAIVVRVSHTCVYLTAAVSPLLHLRCGRLCVRVRVVPLLRMRCGYPTAACARVPLCLWQLLLCVSLSLQHHRGGTFVWNFPIDVTFKSTNPFGKSNVEPCAFLQCRCTGTSGKGVLPIRF